MKVDWKVDWMGSRTAEKMVASMVLTMADQRVRKLVPTPAETMDERSAAMLGAVMVGLMVG